MINDQLPWFTFSLIVASNPRSQRQILISWRLGMPRPPKSLFIETIPQLAKWSFLCPSKSFHKTIGHLGVDHMDGPLREFKERKKIDRNAGKAGLHQNQSAFIGYEFSSPSSNSFKNFIQQRLDILSS